MRPPSWPLVLIQTSNPTDCLYWSAKSCAEWRARKYAMMKRRAERTTKRSPTDGFPVNGYAVILPVNITYWDEIENQKDAKLSAHSPRHPTRFFCMLHGRCVVVPVSLAAHSHQRPQRSNVDVPCDERNEDQVLLFSTPPSPPLWHSPVRSMGRMETCHFNLGLLFELTTGKLTTFQKWAVFQGLWWKSTYVVGLGRREEFWLNVQYLSMHL